MPLQGLQGWPLPVAMPHVPYSPYYGYPGLASYGMQMMPPYQPGAYMEPPSFVVPHTHLHLLDYRRLLNPQHYQTMAYHSRKFRYQHNSSSRETSTAEVQTEPLTGLQGTRSTANSAEVEAPSGLDVRSSDRSFCGPSHERHLSASAVQKPASNGSFVIQTEEVRIECCAAPVGLQLLHASDATGASLSFSQDAIQCSSVLDGRAMPEDESSFSTDESDRPLEVCPDILLVAEKFPMPETKNQALTVNTPFSGVTDDMRSDKYLDETSRSLDLKVVHLPFDQQYLDELRKMESSVWSMEETLLSSPQSLIQNVSTGSHDETLIGETTVILKLGDEAPEVPLQVEREGVVQSVEDPEAVFCPLTEVPAPKDSQVTEQVYTEDVVLKPEVTVLEKSPLKAETNGHRPEPNVQEPPQDTSFESLPAYLPSTSWFSDIDGVYYYGKMPPAPQKWHRPPNQPGLDVQNRRRKLELDYKDQPNVRKSKFKPQDKTDRQSQSDHEYCLSRGLNENAFAHYGPKQDQFCSRCVVKHANICSSVGTDLHGRSLKRKAVPFHQWNHGFLPTCEACRSHSKRRLSRNGSIPDVSAPHWGLDAPPMAGSGDSSENSSCHAGTRRPLASSKQLQPLNPKLREKNRGYDEAQLQPAAWERARHCPHGNAIRDENTAVHAVSFDQRRSQANTAAQRWQTAVERSWKMALPNILSAKNTQSRYWNQRSQPLPQGIHRKDTRC